MLVTLALGLPLWWITGRISPATAVFVGYGSHLFADMMTLGASGSSGRAGLSLSSPAATTTA